MVSRPPVATPGPLAGRTTVRRLILFCAVFAVVLLGVGRLVAQDDEIVVEARMGATYQEADEGYFSFGQDAMVVAKQVSELQKWLKAHVGQRMKVRFEPETPSDK